MTVFKILIEGVMIFFSDNDTYFGSEVRLINSLFANYNKQARPVLNFNTTVDVNISLIVTTILGIVSTLLTF